MSTRPGPRTHGVCSVLTGEAYAGAMALWDHLEYRHGLREVRAAIHPHVSYIVGECGQPDALGARLAEVAPAIAPISLEIDGVDVFEGPPPVVFLRVVKSPALLDIHSRLLDATRAFWDRVWPHYVATGWCPHVTLALRDLAPEHLAAVLADLRDHMTRFTTQLDSLDLVHVVLPRHVYLGRLALGSPPPAGA